MHVFIDAFWYPKPGNTPEEFEDAFCPSDLREVRSNELNVAVADGATQSIFSGKWAQLLTTQFCENGLLNAAALVEALPSVQKKWVTSVTEKALPWYAERKVQMGAFASLLGINLVSNGSSPSIKWRCVAVGDSCIFHVRANKILTTFPLVESRAFEANPHLICSVPSGNDALLDHFITIEGDCEIDDIFLLSTDMVARCLVKLCEENEDPWENLRDLNTSEELFDWLEPIRKKFLFKHDDATLLRICVAG